MVYAKTRNEKEWKKHITSFICVLVASIIMSINIKSFVRAGDLIPGGFTGLSLLIQRSCSVFFQLELPYSLINISFVFWIMSCFNVLMFFIISVF